MAVIYYPSDTTVYTRQVSGSNLIEETLELTPDAIFVFTSSMAYTASFTASYAVTSSYALNGTGNSSSSSWASSSLSSSYSTFQGTVLDLNKPTGQSVGSTAKQIQVSSGSVVTLLNYSGSSGYLDDLWIALSSPGGDDGSILTIITDGNIVYNNRYDRFFAQLLYRSLSSTFDTMYVQNRGGQGSFIPIPFANSISITYTSNGSAYIWWELSYQTNVVANWTRTKQLKTSVNSGVALSQYQTASLIDISGSAPGKLLGVYLFVDSNISSSSPASAPLEGLLTIWTDNTQSYQSSGTEDYFKMAGYFGQAPAGTNVSPYIALSCKQSLQWGGVRFHILDPHTFNNSLKITWTAGYGISFTGQVVPSWVVYYYTE